MTPPQRPPRKSAARKKSASSRKSPGKKATAAARPKRAVGSKAVAAAARPAARPAPRAASRTDKLVALVQAALDDMKAVNARVLDVRGQSDIADFMVVASGNSDRHVKAIADRVVQQAKAAGVRPWGIEGERDGEWVLVDLPDVLVHVMLPRAREFYALEQLWEPVRSAQRPRASQRRP
jgi:ribosome-associated protein